MEKSEGEMKKPPLILTRSPLKTLTSKIREEASAAKLERIAREVPRQVNEGEVVKKRKKEESRLEGVAKKTGNL